MGHDGRVWFLAPEIQLYYKAKAARAKDEVDFAAVLPHLSVAGRAWLLDAIRTSFGEAQFALDMHDRRKLRIPAAVAPTGSGVYSGQKRPCIPNAN
jgi:hypothetical protein